MAMRVVAQRVSEAAVRVAGKAVAALAAALGRHASPAYQALVPLRQRAADVTLLLFEE
jgi:uncharacterized protein (DUF1330 family)